MNNDILMRNAKNGDHRAQYGLALNILSEARGYLDVSESIYWFELSAHSGFSKAQYELGKIYISHDKRDECYNDYDKAEKYLLMASKQGMSEASLELGKLYFVYKKTNTENAISCFIEAAHDGINEARYYLGRVYTTLGKNREGFEWYKLAAENDHSISQLIIGHMYMRGTEACDIDKNEGVQWCLKSAKLGNLGAMLCVAKYYEEGTGVFPDKNESAKWYNKIILSDSKDTLLLAYKDDAREGLKRVTPWYKKLI